MAEVRFRNVQELHQLPADIIVAGVVCGRVVRTATGEFRADTVLYTVCGEKRVSGYGVDRMAAYLDSRRRMREEALYVLRALDDTESPAYGPAAAVAQDASVLAGAKPADEVAGGDVFSIVEVTGEYDSVAGYRVVEDDKYLVGRGGGVVCEITGYDPELMLARARMIVAALEASVDAAEPATV